MGRFNDMNKSQRAMQGVISVKVCDVDNKSGWFSAERRYPNGRSEIMRLCCSFSDELSVGDAVDIMPILNGSMVGWKTMGKTLPRYIKDGDKNDAARTAT